MALAASRADVREVSAAGELPALSVVIAVRNDPENLDLCLRALEASEHFSYEVIVVDDASTVDVSEVARRYEVRLIRQETRTGPAAARNRGAEAARHPHLFFIDADVCVRPDTLERVAERFLAEPPVDAFFGSYDASPGAPGFLSQYRNLLHHYVHQSGREESSSFWSGCGAIKRSVFWSAGGFDTGYANASIEDIELGSRLSRAGHPVELVKDLQVKHMKRWKLWPMIRTDVENRGIPWTRLLLRQGAIPNDLNLRYGQRLSALCAAGLVAALTAGLWHAAAGRDALRPWWPAALGFFAAFVLLNLGFYRFLARVKSPAFALRAVPFHLLYYLYSGLAFGAGLVSHLRRRRPPRRGG